MPGPFLAVVFKLAATPPTPQPLMEREHNRHLQEPLSLQVPKTTPSLRAAGPELAVLSEVISEVHTFAS